MRARLFAVLALATLLVPLGTLPARSAPLCFGEAPTIYAVPGEDTNGTPGDDVIWGTDGDDDISGGKGNDRICGNGGRDFIRGGIGRDRISGGPGDDFIFGDGGMRNTLNGGPGNDQISAYGDRDSVVGNGGDDYIYAYPADYGSLRGGPGNDEIISGDWAKLDAGGGVDFCRLDNGVVPQGCETIRLFCGWYGVDLPADLGSLPGLSQASGDFDGSGEPDTMYVWNDPALGWILHVETDDGYGAQHVFGDPAEYLAAMGGYDINGDGVDEIFMQTGSNPRPEVGIGTLWLPNTAPLDCTIEGPEFGAGGEPLFEIGPSPDPTYTTAVDNGLACQPAEDELRLYVQYPFPAGDPDTFLQNRYDFIYEPRFGLDQGRLVDTSDYHLLFDTPESDAAIQRAREFRCPGLSLP